MKRWLVPLALYAAVTLALTYPLVAHPGSTIPHDIGDPVLNTWLLHWSTERWPLTPSWWNAPMFYPMASAMALSELLIGLLPLTASVQTLTGSPLVAYNVAFLLTFPLCGIAMYALALDLTGHRDAAFLAGVAFAFAPYRMGQLAHIQMLAYFWAPVALLGLHRYVRSGARRWLALFAAAWLMQALSNGYALFHLSVLVLLWMLWFVRSRRDALSIGVAWLAAALPLAPLLLKYQAVHTSLHLVRDINEIKRFGLDLADFASAASDLTLWGARLPMRDSETAAFPGATLVAIGAGWLAFEWWQRKSADRLPRRLDQQLLIGVAAVAALVALSTVTFGAWAIGPLTVSDFHKPFSIAVAARLLAFLRSPWMTRAWRERSVVVFYLVAGVAAYVLALGPEPRLLGRPLLYEPPYAWLMRLPGFDVLRVPARFVMLAVLCQAVVLAFGVAALPPLGSRRRVLTVALCAGLLADAWIRLPVVAVPDPGPAWSNVAAVVEFPPGSAAADFGALYRSMSHHLPVVNGFSSYAPPHYVPFVHAIRDAQYSVLHELAPGAAIGIALSRSNGETADIEAALAHADGIEPGPGDAKWATFVVHPRAATSMPTGTPISLREVVTNRHQDDIGRLLDHNVETAWASGLSQTGDEELIVDLGSEQEVGAVVFELGAYAFGCPRDLEIDSSSDRTNWTPVWNGPTAVLAVRAAIAEPGRVPLTIDLGQVTTRFLRLRQLGTEPGIPWWIADLELRRPATAVR